MKKRREGETKRIGVNTKERGAHIPRNTQPLKDILYDTYFIEGCIVHLMLDVQKRAYKLKDLML
jgi:hypothetical protein